MQFIGKDDFGDEKYMHGNFLVKKNFVKSIGGGFYTVWLQPERSETVKQDSIGIASVYFGDEHSPSEQQADDIVEQIVTKLEL